MLDELQRRNYSQNTVSTYLHAVEDFSRYFHRSPDRLGPDHIRQYQAYLFRERKLQAGTIALCTAALRFLYVKTLRRPYLPEHIPFPKRPRQLPVVLSPEEVQRLIDSAENLMRRTMVMTLYSTGIRCSELCHLKAADIDSQRMVIHIHKRSEEHTSELQSLRQLVCRLLLENKGNSLGVELLAGQVTTILESDSRAPAE